MRVLHITTEFPPVIYGGLGTAVGGLVNACARAGMTVGVLLVGGALVIGGKVYHAYGRPAWADNVVGSETMLTSADGVEFLQVPWDNAVEPAVRLARDWQPDVVHLHTHWAWPVARAIQDQIGRCLIYTVHSVDRAEYELGEEGPNLLDRCDDQQAALAAANRVIALTRHEHRLLSHYYPWAQCAIRIVGNGIDDDSDAREAVRRDRLNESALVLYSGRLVDRKGIAELLSAVPRILACAPATRFVLAGGPAHWSAADVERQWLTPELHPYRGQIRFTGWLSASQIAHWYREADVLVVPSRYEPFGMVVLEGMLHGLPVVAAAVGGPKEILAHERTGILFPAKDVDALVQSLLRLIEDRALRKRIGNAAAKAVRRRWLWRRVVKEVSAVYEEAVSANAKGRGELINKAPYAAPLEMQPVIGMEGSLA